MTKNRISNYNKELSKIAESNPEHRLYINCCIDAGIELKFIHSIVIQKIELIELIGDDEYLIGLYKELECLFACSKVLEIIKAYIRIKEIIANNPAIQSNKILLEVLNNSVIKSPELLKKLERFVLEIDKAA